MEDASAKHRWDQWSLFLDPLLGFGELYRIRDAASGADRPEAFAKAVLDELQVTPLITDKDLKRIPSSGPALLVSNHPFGALDGLVLVSLLPTIRQDVKFIVNSRFQQLTELADLFIHFDLSETPEATKNNVRAMKEAYLWLRKGGMIATFPAGEVSSITWRRWRSRDRAWNTNLVRLVRGTHARIVPCHFVGQNSWVFQVAGLIHPALRTPLLPKELLKMKGKNVEFRVGKPISADKVLEDYSEYQVAEYCRFRSYLLEKRQVKKSQLSKLSSLLSLRAKSLEPIVPHLGAQPLAKEVANLPESQHLLETGDVHIAYAHAWQIPELMYEIGRLREETFRREGEGTGKGIDIDGFDDHYLHLFAWHKEHQEVMGAYRVGRTDEILHHQGIKGLYTSHLFKYRRDFAELLSPGLELGRSFVQVKYQRGLSSLILLWKGIAQFLIRNPRYKHLFGPVSISGAYSEISRELVVKYMQKHEYNVSLASMVQARSPLRSKKRGGDQSFHHPDFQSFITSIDDLGDLISDVDATYETIPILLKHYLKLGGTLVGFNVDKSFNNALDGLIVVDLLNCNDKTLKFYMGKDGLASYQAHDASLTEDEVSLHEQAS